ncbi:MAG: GIDE domain-containing protein [Gammaproteobacteria bacterium]|jgi:hypothetical protein
MTLTESVRSADAGDFWFWTALAVVVTLILFYLAFRFLKRARIIEDTPTSKVRSAAQGYVELIGRGELMPGDPVLAPLTGKPCTWWSFSVEEKRTTYRNGRSETSWHTVESATSDELFFLVDETGHCIVDPDGAEVTPGASDTWYGHTARPTQGPASSSGLLASGRYRYTEKRMEPGAPLYGLGFFQTRGGAREQYDRNAELGARLAAWKRDQAGLLQRFDRNHDGRIDMAEWELARQAAMREVDEELARRGLEPGINMLVRPPDRRPFLLAPMGQDGLSRRYRYMAAGCFFGFLVVGSTATWLLVTRLTGG